MYLQFITITRTIWMGLEKVKLQLGWVTTSGTQIFHRNLGALPNSRHQQSDMKQVQYRGPTILSNLGTCYLVFFTWCTYTDTPVCMYRNKCNIYGQNIRCHCIKFSFPDNQEPASVHPWYKSSNTCHTVIVKFMAFSDHISRFKKIY